MTLWNITFLYPAVFLLWIAAFFLVLFLYFKKWNTSRFAGFSDLEKAYWSNAISHKIYYLLIFLISFVFITILAHPVEYSIEEKIEKNGIDIELVLDLSYSMIAEDLKPNRLEVAKWVLQEFVSNLEADRVWLVLFSGKPFTSVPLTFDYAFLKEYIWDIAIETIDRNYRWLWWTAIWDALVVAYDRLKDAEGREKVIILITDGEANAGLDPLVALRLLKDNNIRTYTIWVWWTEDTFITVLDERWFTQKVAVWWVDEDTLMKIANETGWKYFEATSKDALSRIFTSISELEKKEIEVDVIQNKKDRYEPFVWALVFLFILLLGLIYKKHIKIG